MNIFPNWISKLCIREHNNHSKASSDTGRFTQNLHVCKKSQYNVQNCKSGIYNRSHTSIDVGTSIPIYTCKLAKNYLHIIGNRPLYSCSLHYGKNQRIKYNDISSIIPIKDIKLFYRHIERLLFTSKITRPSVWDCVTSFFHNNVITSELLQERILKYRYIIHEGDTHVCIVISRW